MEPAALYRIALLNVPTRAVYDSNSKSIIMNTAHASLIVTSTAAGDIGSTLASMRQSDYTVVGFDNREREDHDDR